MDMIHMIDIDAFTYVKSSGEVKISGKYSYDMDLFYTLDEIRNLFKWDVAVKEFE